jgi:hypothetical protein
MASIESKKSSIESKKASIESKKASIESKKSLVGGSMTKIWNLPYIEGMRLRRGCPLLIIEWGLGRA